MKTLNTVKNPFAHSWNPTKYKLHLLIKIKEVRRKDIEDDI